MKKWIHYTSILLLALYWILLFSGCGYQEYYNKKADDSISEAIYRALGEKVYYCSKEEIEPDICTYNFLIRDSEDTTLLIDFVNAINEELAKGTARKVRIQIMQEISGGKEPIVVLYNYYKKGNDYKVYEGLQRIEILGTRVADKDDEYIYNNPTTYINLKNVKYLVVSEKIVQNAKEKDIDWYEIWPELEYYEEYSWG